MRFWSVFLSYIILIGFANCILYGGHRLAFWCGAEHRDYWPQNIRLCFAFSCFDALEVGIWTRLLKKNLFVFYTIFAIFKPYHRRIVYFWRRFIIVMLALIFGLFLAILESKLYRKLKGLKIATFAFSGDPFFIISQRVFALFQELTVLRWLGPVLGVMCSSHILRPPCLRNGANHREGALLIICTQPRTGITRLICFSKTRFLYFS